MNFKQGLPIYAQIAARLTDEILSGKYPPGARIPSVREYSALLEVNINTTMKGYELLAREGVVENRRGMGYFVSDDAIGRLEKQRRKEFFEEDLPELLHRMQQIGISRDELIKHLKKSAGDM